MTEVRIGPGGRGTDDGTVARPPLERPPDGRTESLLVKVHPGLCEGWGECHRWAPKVYPLDEEGCIDVHRLQVPPELAVSAWHGAQACPVGVITIVAVVVDAPDP